MSGKTSLCARGFANCHPPRSLAPPHKETPEQGQSRGGLDGHIRSDLLLRCTCARPTRTPDNMQEKSDRTRSWGLFLADPGPEK